MDPVTISILTNIATGMLANFSTDTVKGLFEKVFEIKPELEEKLKEAKNSKDVELVFKEAIGVIDANADKGNITVDGGLLEALRGIRFDHAHGTVNISNTEVKSEVLVTGGSASSTGTTTIKDNTILKTKGTSISVGNGCSITMTGGATITQT